MTPSKKNTGEIVHKLDYDEDDHEHIVLIAIKSNMPDYKMAYHLNRSLGIRLEKLQQEISLTTENGITYFRNFQYEDCKNHLNWRLIENKSNYSISNLEEAGPLFKDESDLFASTEYLIQEWKTIDYFILVENADHLFDEVELLEKLDKIKNVSTQFVVEPDSLSIKSQKNLIF